MVGELARCERDLVRPAPAHIPAAHIPGGHCRRRGPAEPRIREDQIVTHSEHPWVQDPATPRKHRGRVRKGFIAALVLGWVCLLWATDLSLLSAIQIGMVGLGAIGTAIVLAVWPRPS